MGRQGARNGVGRWPHRARKWHRWGAVAVALPFLVVILSGILLQLKKESDWIQPPTAHGSSQVPSLSYEALLHKVQAVPEAEVHAWSDIDRLDVRPDRGVVKVRCRNGVEVQLDHTSGALLHVAVRRSDWIESLHDGSWFHEYAKLWLFLPTAVAVLGLWLSGLYLWWLPIGIRRRKPRRGSGNSRN